MSISAGVSGPRAKSVRRRPLARAVVLGGAVLGVVLLSGLAGAEESTKPDLESLSLEELLDVRVISGSRQEQPIAHSSTAVSVITAEDIHASGLTTLAEILQFAAGLDVIPIDRERFAVGVRGLHGEFSERTLTLVNGRAADNPSFGGSEFQRLPLFLEDIERIEIVRGPGGAAWGANAFTGVINVITKSPAKVAAEGAEGNWGLFGSGTMNQLGDVDSELRWARESGPVAWRAAVGFREHESSGDALDGDVNFQIFNPQIAPLIGFNGYEARDYARNVLIDTEAVYSASDRTKVTTGLGMSRLRRGDREFIGSFHMRQDDLDELRAFTRLDHELGESRQLWVQWYGNFARTGLENVFPSISSENELEAQYALPLGSDHHLSVGANGRFVHIDIDHQSPTDFRLAGEPFDEQWAGLYAIDRWEVAERVALEGQLRGDYYSDSDNEADWSGRATALYTLDGDSEQVLRAGIARAFRTPKVTLRKTEGPRIPLPPDGSHSLFTILPPSDPLQNEGTWALEVGYSGHLAEPLTLRIDAYYQPFQDLIGRRVTSQGPLNFVMPDNIDGAESYGAEIEASLHGAPGRLSAWYAFHGFETDQAHQGLRAFLPARHSVGATGRANLPLDLILNVNYRYSSVTEDDGSSPNQRPIGAFNRVDVTLLRSFLDKRIEVAAGVRDAANESRDAVFGEGYGTAFESLGRTFFARLQLRQ